MLESEERLLIWLDKDIDQGMFHADFKLAKAGKRSPWWMPRPAGPLWWISCSSAIRGATGASVVIRMGVRVGRTFGFPRPAKRMRTPPPSDFGVIGVYERGFTHKGVQAVELLLMRKSCRLGSAARSTATPLQPGQYGGRVLAPKSATRRHRFTDDRPSIPGTGSPTRRSRVA